MTKWETKLVTDENCDSSHIGCSRTRTLEFELVSLTPQICLMCVFRHIFEASIRVTVSISLGKRIVGESPTKRFYNCFFEVSEWYTWPVKTSTFKCRRCFQTARVFSEIFRGGANQGSCKSRLDSWCLMIRHIYRCRCVCVCVVMVTVL